MHLLHNIAFDSSLNIEEFSLTKKYMENEEVQYKSIVYTCLKNDIENIEPNFESSLTWYRGDKTNYLKMFDLIMNTITKNRNSIYYEFEISDIDTIAFFGLKAKEVKIEIYKNNEKIYESNKHTFVREIKNWYEWTFRPSDYIEECVFLDIPFIYNAKLKIFILNEGDISLCSHFLLGSSVDVGMTLKYPMPRTQIKNKIEKSIDNSKASVKQIYKRIIANVLIKDEQIPDIQRILKKYNDTPCLFLANEQNFKFELMVFGFFKDIDIAIESDYTDFEIELEGIT